MKKKKKNFFSLKNLIEGKVIFFVLLVLFGFVVIFAILSYRPPLSFEDDDDASMGPRNSLHTIRLFGDFTDQESKKYFDLFAKSYQDKKGSFDVNFILKSFPNEENKTSVDLANASECAQKQGFFWELAGLIYERQFLFSEYRLENQSNISILSSFTKEIKGMDNDKLNKCLNESAFQGSIDDDKKEAEKLNLKKSPVAFFDNQQLNSIEEAKKILEKKLK